MIATLITNALAARVLLARQMRSATNIILLALAIAHTLAGTAPLPFILQAHTFGGKRDFLPYGWMCGPFSPLAFWNGILPAHSNDSLANQEDTRDPFSLSSEQNSSYSNSSNFTFSRQQTAEAEVLPIATPSSGTGLCLYTRTILSDFIPIASHTASTWLMVLLAFQRYLHVCHPFASAHRILTSSRVRIISVLLSALAFAFHVSVVAEYKFTPRLVESLLKPGFLFVGVMRSDRQWTRNNKWNQVRIRAFNSFENTGTAPNVYFLSQFREMQFSPISLISQ